MLSEVAKAAAKEVKNNGGNLIFPAPETNKDLEIDSDLNVANVILAEFEIDDKHKVNFNEISDKALKAAKERLKIYANRVFRKMEKRIVKEIWEIQLDDIIEFYSAWVPIDKDYITARSNVARLLAARKNIRDFQANKCKYNVNKSSLDGLRESVLVKDLQDIPKDVKIKENEYLDAIGLIKRVPDENDVKFMAITDTAFDATEVLPEYPYIAFICADGDKMGATLSAMKTAEEHRKFSRQLSKFARLARDKVRKNLGTCVYTGGDDVLAFVPLDKALKCSRELHDLFAKIMSDYDVSLSVGMSIAHAKELLSELLDFSREAEKIAKGTDRNGLAISLRARGNLGFSIREQWKSESKYDENSKLSGLSLDDRIEYFAECFENNKIPVKFPYELRENAKFYKNWNDTDKNVLREAIVNDVTRIFSNKGITIKNIGDYIKSKVKNSETLIEFANELIFAQWVGASKKEKFPTLKQQ